MIKLIAPLALLLLVSCTTGYLPLSYGSEESYVAPSEEEGSSFQYSLEGDYRSASQNPFLLVTAFSVKGDLYKVKASGTYGQSWRMENSALYSLYGTARIFGGIYTDWRDFSYPGYGMGGQMDLQRTTDSGSSIHTTGLLYSCDYEIENPYRQHRRDVAEEDSDSLSSTVDLGSNGLSSSFQIYYQWNSHRENNWIPFIRPFIGGNLPNNALPLVLNDEGYVITDLNTGLYTGICNDQMSIYVKGKIDALLAVNLSTGITF